MFKTLRNPGEGKLSNALLLGLLTIALGCSTASLRSIAVTPAAGTEVLNSAGQTVQYKAIGSYQQGKHPATTEDVTSAVTWSSSNTAVATVSSAGVVTAVGSGSAVITATGNGASGIISGSSDVTVTLSSTSVARTLSSIAIIPSSGPVTSIGETVQFLAIGTYSSAPITQDLTTQVTWGSSDVFVAKIDATGLATAVSAGTTTITALYTPAATSAAPNPATVSSTANFILGSGSGTVTLATLAIYKVGVNASAGSVTGTYKLTDGTVVQAVACGPGDTIAKCTAYVPPSTTMTLTTTTHAGFGGWSSDCTVSDPTNPYTCTITLPAVSPTGAIGNVTVGAIFD